MCCARVTFSRHIPPVWKRSRPVAGHHARRAHRSRPRARSGPAALAQGTGQCVERGEGRRGTRVPRGPARSARGQRPPGRVVGDGIAVEDARPIGCLAPVERAEPQARPPRLREYPRPRHRAPARMSRGHTAHVRPITTATRWEHGRPRARSGPRRAPTHCGRRGPPVRAPGAPPPRRARRVPWRPRSWR